MQIKNKIINYFVFRAEGSSVPMILSSPITMPNNIAKQLIQKKLKDEKKNNLMSGPVLHVCYDFDSQIIYTLNASDFGEDNYKDLLQAAKLRITQDFESYSARPPVQGSPFSLIRIRSLNSFAYARNTISKHYKGKIFNDIPIIEAFLRRMPTTKEILPPLYSAGKGFMGGYIGTSFAESVSFVEEIDLNGKIKKEPQFLLTQKTPFILIDISQTKEHKTPTASEKEWVVLNAYRDYLNDTNAVKENEKYISEDLSKFSDLYAIKRLLYLGWPFEQVTSYLMQNSVNNFGELMKSIDLFMTASRSLVEEGYKNVAEVPYYMTFKIDDSFPFKMDTIIDKKTGRVSMENQYPYFLILDYDINTGYVLIETPVFIPPVLCVKVLNAKSNPFISRYNQIVNKMDIKSSDISHKELQSDKMQLEKIKALTEHDLTPEKQKDLDFRSGQMASGENFVNPNIYTIRRVSDYLYAAEFIKDLCDKNGIKFKDFDVVCGPIERVFGRGVQGGFMDNKMFQLNKMKTPTEIEKGIWISPPVMLINSLTIPTAAEQTETLIHEYTHYIYSELHPDYKMQYDSKQRKGNNDYEYWWNYFEDPNEKEAHINEIKLALGLGKSGDEILREKVGGAININNYPIAIKFKELYEEAVKQIEEEEAKNEKPNE